MTFRTRAAVRSRNFGGTATRIVLALSVIVLLPLSIYVIANLFVRDGYTPIETFGAPVFVEEDGGGRVILLTGQWRTLTLPGRRAGAGYDRVEFYVDLWAVDADTAQPLWRKRLEAERDGGFIDRSLLGVDRGTVWLLLHGKLVGMSASDGSVIAPAGRVEAENPELKGLMPMEDRYYQFDRRGLHITAADARGWRVDPATSKVLPDTGPAVPIEGAFPPEFMTPGSSKLHLVRGIDIPDHWLGLLTEAEARTFEENNEIGSLTPETRRRLWGGNALKSTNFFGDFLDYTELKPLPESPDFLDAGLLREYREGQQLPALWVREPDSVFVLHRGRLGEAGKLMLTRVAGPRGNEVWEAPLPLTLVNSVKRMEKTLLLFGREFTESDPGVSDAVRDSPQRLVSIDLETGDVHVHSHSALDTHPSAETVELGL